MPQRSNFDLTCRKCGAIYLGIPDNATDSNHHPM